MIVGREEGEQLPWIVSDGLWERIEPPLPRIERRYRHPGRRRLPDRQVLCGILFVLYTAIPGEFLPQELAPAGRLARGRGLAAATRASAGRDASGRAAGLVQGGGRQRAPTSPQGGPKPVRARSTAPRPARNIT